MRGRKRLPTHLRAIDGGCATTHRPGPARPGREALAAGAPAVPESVAEHPDAAAFWDRFVPGLVKAGLAAPEFEPVIAELCLHYGLHLEAAREFRRTGGELVVKTPNGYPMDNPYLTVVRRHLRLARSCCVELGLSPTALSRAERLEPQGDLFDDGDPMREFMGS